METNFYAAVIGTSSKMINNSFEEGSMNKNTTMVFSPPFSIKEENFDKFAQQPESTEPNKHTDTESLESRINQYEMKTEQDLKDFVIESTQCLTRNTYASTFGSDSEKPGSILLTYLFSKSLSEQQPETKAKNKDGNFIGEIENVNKFTLGDCKLKTEEIQIRDEENEVSMTPNHLKHQEKNNKVKAIHKCPQCDYTTDNKSHLKGHSLCHPKPDKVLLHKCDKCHFETNYKKNLKRHIIVKHTNLDEVNTFKCDKCDYETSYKIYIKEHILKHTNPKETPNYQCSYCDYKSIYRRNLNRHLVKKHKDPKDVRFKCEICSFRTYESRTLKSHYLGHKRLEGIKMYACQFCASKSVSEHALNRHVYKRHLDQLKPFKCEECGVRAVDESALTNHFLRQHKYKKIKKFRCNQCSFETLYKNSLKVHFNKHRNTEQING